MRFFLFCRIVLSIRRTGRKHFYPALKITAGYGEKYSYMKNFSHIKNYILDAGSYAVTHIPNCCMVKILHLFTLIKISPEQIQMNFSANERILTQAASAKSGFFTPNCFIENQNQWEEVKFGLSTMKYSGCEIMAVYNALLELGNEMTVRKTAELITSFEKRGSELSGKWGCSPTSIRQYFTRHEYRVILTTKTNPEAVNFVGANSDTVIITAYNDRNDIRRMIHTVSITKDAQGNFVLHNAYKKANDKYTAYGGSKPIKNLWDAIGCMAQGQAAPICVMGIIHSESSFPPQSPCIKSSRRLTIS